jgi:hypothetical protein
MKRRADDAVAGSCKDPKQDHDSKEEEGEAYNSRNFSELEKKIKETEVEINEAVVGIKEATTKLENRETCEADKRVYRKTIDHLQRKGEHLQRKIEYFQRRIECLQVQEKAEIRGARQEVLHAQGSSACFEDSSDFHFAKSISEA